MTLSQLQTLKAFIDADATLSAFPNDEDGAIPCAAALNLSTSPSYWVWRTSVSESEYTRQSAVDTDGVTVTNWSWTTFIGRSQGERDAWPRLFMGGGTGCNPALANVRSAFSDIFSGAGGANQRAHLLASSRRLASRFEKLFATGTGSASVPALMGLEGPVSAADVNNARHS